MHNNSPLPTKWLFFIGGGLILLLFFLLFRTITGNQNANNFLTPTPFANISPTLRPTFIPRGEEGFSKEAQQELLEIRKRADKAFADRKKRIPFLTKLPYQSTNFKIEIRATSDTIFITTPPPASLAEQYRNEALEWISANGGDPDKLTIEYQVGSF